MAMVDLYFETFGASEAKPLIILHGFFASSRNWRQVAEKLASQSRVYVLDQRNHGVSPHHPEMDYPVMADDLLRFMDRQNLAKVSLLGHSMGGKVAMWFALNHPDRMDKLIVADIAPVNYQHSFDGLLTALKALPLADLSNRKQAEGLLAAAIPELSYRQFLLQNLVLDQGYRWRIDLDIFQRTADNIVAFPALGRIPTYPGKALFLAGENSHYVRLEQVQGLFPQAEFQTIAGAGHWLHVQQPALFLDLVSSFLR